jgi:hypothetical protein
MIIRTHGAECKQEMGDEPEEELEVEPQRAEDDELGEEEIEPEPPEEEQGEQQ